MKLSDNEKLLLPYLELNANATLDELQKKTGLRSHTIHYTINKLEQRGMIKKLPFMDMRRLGYDDYAIYFSLATQEKDKQKLLLDFLLKAPDVTLIAEFGGDYQYGIALYAKRLSQFHTFLQKLNAIVPGIFFEKSINIRASFTRFNRAYLDSSADRQYITLKPTETIHALSEIDQKIIHLLHTSEASSFRDIAKQTDIPFSTVRYHMNSLQEKKIISCYSYHVDSTQYGASMYELLISVKGFTSTISQDLFSFCEEERHVIHFLECIGDWDFEIGIEVLDTQTVRTITESIYERFGQHIQTMKIIPFFRFRKYRFYPLN